MVQGGLYLLIAGVWPFAHRAGLDRELLVMSRRTDMLVFGEAPADAPPFMWIPAALLEPAAALGWLGVASRLAAR